MEVVASERESLFAADILTATSDSSVSASRKFMQKESCDKCGQRPKS